MTEKKELSGLIRRIQKGDLEAFATIYDRFFESVYSYVLRQVGTAADAEDITSAVFLEVLEKIDGFTWKGAGFSPWIFRIARNDILDHFRRQGGRRRETPLTEEMSNLPNGEPVDLLVEKAWHERKIRAAVTQLSEEQRQVILLKMTLNFSNRQVGTVIDKSEGAVKALQHRAHGTLRKILAEEQAPSLQGAAA